MESMSHHAALPLLLTGAILASACADEVSTEATTGASPDMIRVDAGVDDGSPSDHIEGLNSLYMGHSYFRRQAEAMADFAEVARVEGHTSTSFFRGGYNGSAFAIWDDADSQATIQEPIPERADDVTRRKNKQRG